MFRHFYREQSFVVVDGVFSNSKTVCPLLGIGLPPLSTLNCKMLVKGYHVYSCTLVMGRPEFTSVHKIKAAVARRMHIQCIKIAGRVGWQSFYEAYGFEVMR